MNNDNWPENHDFFHQALIYFIKNSLVNIYFLCLKHLNAIYSVMEFF